MLNPDNRAAVENRIIRTDQSSEPIDVKVRPNIQALAERINAATCCTVLLRHLGEPLLVMIVDDIGHRKGLPPNDDATALYWRNCVPGTTHMILGDVAIVRDDLFASEGVL
jgi:hypothetical protein